MAKSKRLRHQIELVGGPLDGATYTIKYLPEILELNTILELDSMNEFPFSDEPEYYYREKFCNDFWLYVFKYTAQV